jgi:hypothetical protein
MMGSHFAFRVLHREQAPGLGGRDDLDTAENGQRAMLFMLKHLVYLGQVLPHVEQSV